MSTKILSIRGVAFVVSLVLVTAGLVSITSFGTSQSGVLGLDAVVSAARDRYQTLQADYRKHGLLTMSEFLSSGNQRSILEARIEDDRTLTVVIGNPVADVYPGWEFAFYDQAGNHIASARHSWAMDKVPKGGRYPEKVPFVVLTPPVPLPRRWGGLKEAYYIRVVDKSDVR